MDPKTENAVHEDFIDLDEAEENEAPADDGQDVINFNVNDANIAKVKEEFANVDAYKDIEAAKAAKKVLTKMRTTLTAAHKAQKAESLAYGRKLDGEKNRLLVLIGEIEDPITNDITAIKNAEAQKEEERVSTIMAHIERLQSYALDRHDLNVEQIKERRANLAKEPLTEEIYQELLGDAKMSHEEADSKLRIVLQRELDAEEERAKQAKIAEEQAARQKELDDRQAKMDAEDAQRKAEQKAREEAARKEQADKDAKKQAELDAQAEELAAKQKKIDDENTRIAKEKADKDAAEKKATEEEAERKAAAERAPDREKLLGYALAIEALLLSAPVMQTQEGANTLMFANEQLTEVADTVRKCVEEMK